MTVTPELVQMLSMGVVTLGFVALALWIDYKNNSDSKE